MYFHIQRWPVVCAWTPVKCLLIWYSLKVSKSAPQLHCHFVVGGTSQLTCSTCKLFRAPLFMLLVVLYNFVYYNYIIITQLLVGWFGDQGKKGVCVSKKVHCGPVHTCIPNMIEYNDHTMLLIFLFYSRVTRVLQCPVCKTTTPREYIHVKQLHVHVPLRK